MQSMTADEAKKMLIQFYTLNDAPLRDPEWDALQDFSEEVAYAFAVLAEVRARLGDSCNLPRHDRVRPAVGRNAANVLRGILAEAHAAITDPEEEAKTNGC